MTIDQQLAALARRTERIVPEADLRAKLERSAKTGTPLRIKLGMDPTAPDVTLGHAVPLKVVRQFQDWGHKAVLIIGDYTARVGDPSGRNTTRPVLSGEQIDANAKTYVSQVGKILLTDPDHLEIRFNGEWFAKMNLLDILKLTSQKSVAQMLAREDFHNRYSTGVDIRIHEFLYPLMQGYDSVMIDSDVEMGGSDQLFNNLVGRDLQQDAGKPGQAVIVTPLLVGTDGKIKMSKSKGNYIGVTDPAAGQGGMFGKIMSLPDALLDSYYQLLTDLDMDQARAAISANPRDAKIALAKHVITWLHSADAGEIAEHDFRKATHGQVPDSARKMFVRLGTHKLSELLLRTEMVSTSSEAMRKIAEGAVRWNGMKVMGNQQLGVDTEGVLQIGTKQFVRLTPILVPERPRLPHVVIDTNVAEEPEVVAQAVTRAAAKGGGILIPDALIAELLKPEGWGRNVTLTMASLARHASDVYASRAIGELLRAEQQTGENQSIDALVDTEMTVALQDLLSRVHRGESPAEAVSGAVPPTRIAIAKMYDHGTNKRMVTQIAEGWVKDLTPKELKAISQKDEALFRKKLAERALTASIARNLKSLGWPPDKSTSLAAKPSTSAHFYLSVAALGLHWASMGNMGDRGEEKFSNDLRDLDFVITASFCEELVSRDQLANRLYRHISTAVDWRWDWLHGLYAGK